MNSDSEFRENSALSFDSSSSDLRQEGMPIVTERLELRSAMLEDAPLFLAIYNDEAFKQFVGDRGVRTLEEARDYLANVFDNAMGASDRLLVVRLREATTAIGICSLLQRSNLEAPDLGFAFLPGYRGQGLAHEAARATIEFAREQLGFRKLLAIVSPANEKSVRLLTKLGFNYKSDVQMADDEPPISLFELRMEA